jgi:magnesium chelatase family protein
MARVPFQKLASLEAGEDSAAIRARVEAARKVQEDRFHKWGKPHVLVNGDMGPAEVQAFCDIDEAGRNLMRAAMQQMNLSARAYHRILKLGRTIADLAGESKIQVHHLAEALQYRPRLVA